MLHRAEFLVLLFIGLGPRLHLDDGDKLLPPTAGPPVRPVLQQRCERWFSHDGLIASK